ncbi:hypothetical protein [Microbulbifer spongiae]|uniref:Uncharacterized protein n=1 Tax=Microbulbifer spongiae TaxID=2944933 RepID=A0ABY9EAI8_9GAMM|nr:hypothetical protein [Microbulbifer sp. MI-G]WKD48524.1 hypothetical protein M8T91_11380 [Microbulbifer sp. MI-G]
MKTKSLLIFLCIIIPSTCFAEFHYSGKISQIHAGPQYQDKVLIKIAGEPSGEVACSTNASFTFAFNGAGDGSIYFSLLLSALAAEKTVTLRSSDDCTVHSNVADLRNISIVP